MVDERDVVGPGRFQRAGVGDRDPGGVSKEGSADAGGNRGKRDGHLKSSLGRRWMPYCIA